MMFALAVWALAQISIPSTQLEGPKSSTVAVTVLAATQREPFNIGLAWDQNPEPWVQGYAVYLGLDGLTRREDIGNTTEAWISVTEPGVYTLAVAAYVEQFPGAPGSLRAPSRPIVKP